MKFRTCIDIKNGKVTQIVGSTINKNLQQNFVSEQESSFYAKLYKDDSLTDGHIIMLDSLEDTKRQAITALGVFPGGFQIGGGINSSNAKFFLNAGASKVIVSSAVFSDGNLDLKKLEQISKIVGKDRLVLDLSCLKKNNDYFVVIDKWQTSTNTKISLETFETFEKYCDEILIHSVDNEGKKQGIDEKLLRLLADSNLIITYAGGISSLEDIELIKEIGKNKIDFTVGSALDIFGGNLQYSKLIEFSNI